MRSFGKFTVKVLVAICVLVCSRTALAVAHALGWYPEQQLANFILAAPTALQIETVMWSILALVTISLLLVIDCFVNRRNYRRALGKIAQALRLRLAAIRTKLSEFVSRHVIKQTSPIAVEDSPPVIDNAPGLGWKKLKNGFWEGRWDATAFAKKLGYRPRRVILFRGTYLSDLEREMISESTNILQNEMEIYLEGWRYQRQQKLEHSN